MNLVIIWGKWKLWLRWIWSLISIIAWVHGNKIDYLSQQIKQSPFSVNTDNGRKLCNASAWIFRKSWWRHQMETLSALLTLCAGNSPVTGKFPLQRPLTRSFDFSLIWDWIHSWVNNRDAGDLKHHRAHYDVIVMWALEWLFDHTSRIPVDYLISPRYVCMIVLRPKTVLSFFLTIHPGKW